jgi:membrane associated rhomboid family serine protease
MGRTVTKEKRQTKTVSSQSELPSESVPPVKIDRDKSNLEGLRQEYTEVNNTIRNYSTLRFSIFTVFLAALGGLVSVSFGFIDFKYGGGNAIMLWGRIGGLLVTLLFYIYERRIQYLIDHSLEAGRELEILLHYKHLSTRLSWRWYRGHNATTIFLVIVILFWIIMAIEMLIRIIQAQ